VIASMSGKIPALLAAIGFSASISVVAKEAANMPPSITLSLEDPAPSLAPARIIKGKDLRHFDPGKTYVIEFWATWCGPCKKAMPHLAILARQYRGQVTFISVNITERVGSPLLSDAAAKERVVRFVKDSGDLMENVLMDDAAGTLDAQWLKAAGQVGIPKTYIVTDKKLAWIGSPAELAVPLAQVVAGTYVPALREFKQTQADAEEADRLLANPALREATRTKDYVTQVKIYEEAFAINPRLEGHAGFEFFRVLQHVDPARASSFARGYVARNAPLEKDPAIRSILLGSFARIVLQEKSLQNPDLDLALEFAQESLQIAPEKDGGHYATLAAVFVAKHDLTKAIELQQKAIALAKQTPDSDPDKKTILARYQSTLANYQTAAKKKAAKGHEES